MKMTSNSTFQIPNRPFPQAQVPENKSYKITPFKPTGVSREEMNNAVISQFKQLIDNGDITIDPGTVTGHTKEQIVNMTLAEMVQTNPDAFRAVMRHNTGGGAADLQVTTSESMGYGMLMLVILAGQDRALGIDIKAFFDGMFRSVMFWDSQIRIEGRKSHLMLWQLVQPDGPGTPYKRHEYKHRPENDGNGSCATDGDLDIAYALLLADKQWGSDGKYDYYKYALAMIHDLWEFCIDVETETLAVSNIAPNYHIKGGDWTNTRPHWAHGYGLTIDITRTSDHMLDHLKVFKAVDPVHDWQKVIDSTYACITQLCLLQNPPTGILPDFATLDRKTKTWRPVPATGDIHWESPHDGQYSANACRTPWRLGTDYLLSGKTPIDSVCIKPLGKFLREACGGEFSKLTGYSLDGKPNDDPASFFANPPLVLAAALGDQEWLDNGWNYAKDLEWIDDQYGSYLNVLALIVISGNYWSPV